MPPTRSIRRSLLTHLSVVILLLGSAIVLMMGFGIRRAVRLLSAPLIDHASRATELKLHGFFDPVARQLEAVGRWVEAGVLEEPDRLGELLVTVLEELPWASAVYIADEQGSETLLRRHANGWSRRDIELTSTDARSVTWEYGPDRNLRTSREERLDYDPRTRPWYRLALDLLESPAARRTVHWTNPYRFFSSGDPGMTAVTAVPGSTDHFRVIGIDVPLAEISKFTGAMTLLDTGIVFVLTEDGRLIGLPRFLPHSRSAATPDMLLKTPAEIQALVTGASAPPLAAEPSLWNRSQRVLIDREPWWIRITPYPLQRDRSLLIGVAVPEHDLTRPLGHQRLWVSGILLATLSLAVLRVFRLARSFTAPVEELAKESDRIRAGNLEPGPEVRSFYTEIQQLAEAHTHMRQGLRNLLKLERDLQLAREIQENTLPRTLPILEGWDFGVWNRPADETGGDTYDLIGLARSPEGRRVIDDRSPVSVLLMLADATGHGIGPALSVTQLRSMLRMALRIGTDLTQLPYQLNDQLYADLPSGRFITAWFGLIDSRNQSLTALSAGQAPLLHYRAAEDHFDILSADLVPLGLFPTLPPVHANQRTLEPGDIFAVLSDGFYEAKSLGGEEFGIERVCEAIRHCRSGSTVDLIEHLRTSIDEFTTDRPPDDDRTALVIKRTSGRDPG